MSDTETIPAIWAAGHTKEIKQNKAAPAHGTLRDMKMQDVHCLASGLNIQAAYLRMCQKYSYNYCWPAEFLYKFKIMSPALVPCNNFFFPVACVSSWKWKNNNDRSTDTWLTALVIWALSSWCWLKMSYHIRIRAGEHWTGRIYHKVIRFIGNLGECWCATELSPDYWGEHSTMLSLAPASFIILAKLKKN